MFVQLKRPFFFQEGVSIGLGRAGAGVGGTPLLWTGAGWRARTTNITKIREQGLKIQLYFPKAQ